MARKDDTREPAIAMPLAAEVRLSQGQKIGRICRGFGFASSPPMVKQLIAYRWAQECERVKVRTST
jgi:hypothetical protein